MLEFYIKKELTKDVKKMLNFISLEAYEMGQKTPKNNTYYGILDKNWERIGEFSVDKNNETWHINYLLRKKQYVTVFFMDAFSNEECKKKVKGYKNKYYYLEYKLENKLKELPRNMKSYEKLEEYEEILFEQTGGNIFCLYHLLTQAQNHNWIKKKCKISNDDLLEMKSFLKKILGEEIIEIHHQLYH